MNIKDLMDNAYKRECYTNDLKQLKTEAKKKFTEFKKVCEELSKKIDNKKEEMANKLINEYKEYFSNNFKMLQKGESIIFTYKDVEVILDLEKDYYFSLKIPIERIYVTIEIRESRDYDNMICWKNEIKYRDKYIDYNKPDIFFDDIQEISVLKDFISKIEENISHYKNTIENFDTIKYIYSLYDTSIECDSFKDLFETYINKPKK